MIFVDTRSSVSYFRSAVILPNQKILWWRIWSIYHRLALYAYKLTLELSTVNLLTNLSISVQKQETSRRSDKVQPEFSFNSQIFQAVCSSFAARYAIIESLTGLVSFDGKRFD